MALPLMSVNWKEHSSELAAVCKNLLDENFLVDCSIAAEGQSLKAHRLILSACSPYFHMLFSEENGKYPIVILKDTSFVTLKAVVDFVYHGETQIPEGHLQTFLQLADSLQIKGLNAFPMKGNNIVCNTDSIAPQCSSSDNRDTCKVQSTDVSHEHSPGNSSLQHLLHHSGSYTDTVQRKSSVSFEEHGDSCKEVQTALAMTPPWEQKSPPVCDKPSLDSEITVKNEPLDSVFVETRSEVLDDVKSDEPMSGNFMSNDMGEGRVPAFVEHPCPSGNGNMQSVSVMLPLQQLQQQQVIQEPDEASSGRNLFAQHQPSQLPLLSMPKREQINDAENEEPIQVTCENDVNVMDEETGSSFAQQNLIQSSSTAGSPAARRRGRKRRKTHVCPYCDRTFACAQILAMHLCEYKNERPYSCCECGAPFSGSRALILHKREHAAEHRIAGKLGLAAKLKRRAKRRHGCDICGKSFAKLSSLVSHKRTHTGERPFCCDFCGTYFTKFQSLKMHQRKHTGERPFLCDICGVSFTCNSRLKEHQRKHTGERPFRCDVCGASYTNTGNLKAHQRTHTGERPFRCDICGASFTITGNLKAHQRTHTGERPFRCDVCGASFTQSGHLKAHQRLHTGERPFKCDVCGASYTRSGELKRHQLTHTGERPFKCGVCGASFTQSDKLKIHKRSHTD